MGGIHLKMGKPGKTMRGPSPIYKLLFTPGDSFGGAGVDCFLAIAITALFGSDHLGLAIILHFKDIRAKRYTCLTTFTKVPVNNRYFHGKPPYWISGRSGTLFSSHQALQYNKKYTTSTLKVNIRDRKCQQK